MHSLLLPLLPTVHSVVSSSPGVAGQSGVALAAT
jgi:hypothetical protein